MYKTPETINFESFYFKGHTLSTSAVTFDAKSNNDGKYKLVLQ